VTSGFTDLPDLASRALGGSVVFANDELFAERENLIKPEPPVFSAGAFGPKGKVYDGWETRRRRDAGHDSAVVRLGVPGVIRGVVVDTSWFRGNYPPFASVDATSVEGYPSPDELLRATWETVVEKSTITGDAVNAFEVEIERRYTHVRLNIFPDGGVARFRVHGPPVPDPRFLGGTVDLAAVENGGHVVDCSNRFYSSASNLLLPGRARTLADGWETARRRDGGNDHVTVRLGATGRVDVVELDTSCFIGNAPGWAQLRGTRTLDSGASWTELVPRSRLQPDTLHRFRVASDAAVSQVRLDVFPDGGLARLRVHGRLTEEARAEAVTRWLELLPTEHAVQVLVAECDQDPDDATALLGRRPFTDTSSLPADLVQRLLAHGDGL
jgi:allantoicase